MTEENRFYVYVHRRESDGAIFYVGKGSGQRASTTSGRSEHWNRVAKKHGVQVEIVCEGMLEDEAFDLEALLIAEIEGLCNATEGGEGISGYSHTEDTRRALSEAHRGRKQDPLVVAKRAEKLRGKKRSPEFCAAIAQRNRDRGPASPETRAKMSASRTGFKQSKESIEKTAAAHRGQKRSPAARKRISEGHRARYKKVLCVTTGMVFESMQAASQWVRDNHNPKATRTGIWLACNGRYKTSYGMEWRHHESS